MAWYCWKAFKSFIWALKSALERRRSPNSLKPALYTTKNSWISDSLFLEPRGRPLFLSEGSFRAIPSLSSLDYCSSLLSLWLLDSSTDSLFWSTYSDEDISEAWSGQSSVAGRSSFDVFAPASTADCFICSQRFISSSMHCCVCSLFCCCWKEICSIFRSFPSKHFCY